MNKYDAELLKVLNDNSIYDKFTAMNISQIYDAVPVTKRKAYHTTYKHMKILEKQGYIKRGLSDSLASTYYISETGKLFCNSMK